MSRLQTCPNPPCWSKNWVTLGSEFYAIDDVIRTGFPTFLFSHTYHTQMYVFVFNRTTCAKGSNPEAQGRAAKGLFWSNGADGYVCQ